MAIGGFNRGQADKRYPRKGDNTKAMRALRAMIASQPPPRVVTPTFALSSAAPASTPTAVPSVVSGVASTKFRYSGGPVEIVGGVYPYTASLRHKPLPSSPGSYGQLIVDIVTDAPSLTPWLIRAQGGSARVMVDNDGKGLVELLRCVPAIKTGTAQAGAASTITLDAAASATNGIYFGCWIHLIGGTGSGQYAQITGYVGSTKVATVDHAWTTAPDATTTFEITQSKAAITNSTQSGYTSYYMNFDWAGERRMRHWRIEYSGFGFLGVNTASAIDTFLPPPRSTGTVCIWGGDSFGYGAGSDMQLSNSFARIACDQMGWNLVNLSIGSTGYLNDGTTSAYSFPLDQRWFPPVNAWMVRAGFGASGNVSVTQSGTTVTVATSATPAQVQTAFDTAFGAGKWKIAGVGGSHFWAIGLSTIAASTATMTADFSGITGGANVIEQYLGDLAPRIPKDGAGQALPFVIVLTNGRNDTTGSNAAFTKAAVTAAVSSLITKIHATYPTADVYVTGILYLPGGITSTVVQDCNDGIRDACAGSLRMINGKLPFIDAYQVGPMNGSGFRGALAANGNGDTTTDSDATHPTPQGHLTYGMWLAGQILEIAA
jgi:hypothetical protein